MEITKELIEKYAGRVYDDGEIRGIIAGFDSEDKIRPVLLTDASYNGEECSRTTSEEWNNNNIVIFKPWVGGTSTKWLWNFDPKYIAPMKPKTDQYTYMELDSDFEYPDWWDNTKPPILCWVSDEEDDENPEQAYVCGIDSVDESRRFRTLDGGLYTDTFYKFATPVVAPSKSKEELEKISKLEALRETIRVAQEQMDEILEGE